ncbi:MAG TPA: YhdH/YhfP family quinone oxidoreductase [Anaerohalosphaeraceae bacterium]|jgi:putative YhdH/YhfP family quinone oxidoreductase|nr:YhdH/YhfP family quinone oxidoreductase [Anaerohalosphaeraceae bacterium]HRT48898.1 YhdH/YhfP family quinone oxidoreductase [Anaerohalosphaeraceae bacterium]HRT85021.1 YhdH/YhfP family quinone oxidoreductase [Anaerohalosphaeraceae bacterium]
MPPTHYRALVVRETDGRFTRAIERLPLDGLPPGDLLIRVRYAALNYKDALCAVGHKGIARRYPHTPGIEAAGIVEQSATPVFAPGQAVLVAGFNLGTTTPGAFAEYIRVPAEWAVCPPAGMSLRDAVTCGVAGFTAALALHKLQHVGLAPENGPVLVTGATGGVGSLAVAILARAGYAPTAATGKMDKADYLRRLGAAEVISRQEADDPAGHALLPERWAGAIDSVGGSILAAALKATRYGGAVAACGLAQSADLNTTVYPFILRAVTLIGIDSVHCPNPLRKELWSRLANEWRPENLETVATECPLEQANEKIDQILQGQLTGRTLLTP